MRGWAFLLGGLIVWAVHFLALFIIASVFLTTPLARALALLVTLFCLAACGLLFAKVRRADISVPLERWMRAVALSGIGLSVVAIVWQVLPAIVG